jgi:hypothetical protein
MSLRRIIAVVALVGAAFVGGLAMSAPANASTSSPSWYCDPYFC